jgi:hypothetical protein
VTIDQWQLEKLALVMRNAEVLFYTPGLPSEFHTTAWGRICPTPEAAVAALLEGLPANARVAVIPEGPYVLARAEEAEPVMA